MPANLRNPRIYTVLLFLAVAAVLLGLFLYFYRGGYSPPLSPNVPFEQLTRTTSLNELAGLADFVDAPGVQIRPGTLLVDSAHRNAFDPEEIVTLLSRIGSRGYDVEFMGEFSRLDEDERIPMLEEKLRQADSFLVISPRTPYSAAEIALVQRFIDQGGKVLLIAEPNRPHDINSLSGHLGLEFQPDYLFNQVEYDLNFQNVFLRDFQPDKLTSGLQEVVFYTVGSIKTSGTGLVSADDNTESSLSGKAGTVHPVATGEHRNVLGIYDMTFLVPPHNSVADNNQFISNIADFLTESDREFRLADFPSFFKEDVHILLGQPSLIDAVAATRSLLGTMSIPAELRDLEDVASDTIFLGLYQDSARALQYLEASGVRVGDELSISSASGIPLEDTSIIVLNRSQDRHVLVVLADSSESLTDAIERLASGKFRSGLVDDFVGVYKTE